MLLQSAAGSLGGSKEEKHIKRHLNQLYSKIYELIKSQVAPMASLLLKQWGKILNINHTPYLTDDVTDMHHILCSTIWYHQEIYKSDTLHPLANI